MWVGNLPIFPKLFARGEKKIESTEVMCHGVSCPSRCLARRKARSAASSPASPPPPPSPPPSSPPPPPPSSPAGAACVPQN